MRSNSLDFSSFLLNLLYNCSCYSQVSKKNKVYPLTLIINSIEDDVYSVDYEMLLKDLKFEDIINPQTQVISEYKRVMPIIKKKNNENNPYKYPSKVPITIITNESI